MQSSPARSPAPELNDSEGGALVDQGVASSSSGALGLVHREGERREPRSPWRPL
jgi:hypothetical protein